MAKTTVLTGDALTKKLWEEELFRDTIKEAYFSRFMGKSSDSLAQVKEDLVKSKGDRITYGIRMRLTGTGVISGQTLENNEEKLTTYNFNVSLERYRNAVRDAGSLDRQRAVYDMDAESRDALKDWGTEKIDKLCFDTITTSPTKIFLGGNATTYVAGAGDIDATDIIDPSLISKVKAWCKTGGNRSQTPLRPIKIQGKNYYVLLVHPDVLYDLSQDAAWSQAAREALPRGTDNPIFSGAEYLWDGVLIHSHENVPIVTNWGAGSNIPGAQCILMGAQALLWAWGERPTMVEEEFDYQEEHGYAWRMTCGVAKPNFSSKDYGSVGVYVARTKIADA